MYNNYGVFEGFEWVDTVHLEDEPYQFYILGLWKGADGWYIATDSGCSCPEWWEYTTVDDLTGPLTAEQVREEAQALWDDVHYKGNRRDSWLQDFLANLD